MLDWLLCGGVLCRGCIMFCSLLVNVNILLMVNQIVLEMSCGFDDKVLSLRLHFKIDLYEALSMNR